MYCSSFLEKGKDYFDSKSCIVAVRVFALRFACLFLLRRLCDQMKALVWLHCTLNDKPY